MQGLLPQRCPKMGCLAMMPPLQHPQEWGLPSPNLPLALQVAEPTTGTTPSFGTRLMNDPRRSGTSRCCEGQRCHRAGWGHPASVPTVGQDASDPTYAASQAPLHPSWWCEGCPSTSPSWGPTPPPSWGALNMVHEGSHGHDWHGTLWRTAEPLPTTVSSPRTVFMYVCKIQPCLSGPALPAWLVSLSLHCPQPGSAPRQPQA